jgi:tetratricopeptide (TPR) repeat protein
MIYPNDPQNGYGLLAYIQRTPPETKIMRDRLRDHQRRLDSARDADQLDDLIAVASTLGMLQFGQSRMDEAFACHEEAVHALYLTGDPVLLSREMGKLGLVGYYLGNIGAALDNFMEASAASEDQPRFRGYLQIGLGSLYCYLGLYSSADTMFTQAKPLLCGTADADTVNAGDILGRAVYDATLARELLRDRGEYARAAELLSAAVATLRERAPVYMVIESLLALADCRLRMRDLIGADVPLFEAETMINEYKCLWYRPELLLLNAYSSILRVDPTSALYFANEGLSTVGNRGDARLLIQLYRMLALIWERERPDDSRDALDRALLIGRANGRKLHLALALRQLGNHLKRTSNRPTVRARGSGYLFEADRMFEEMQVPAPTGSSGEF